MTLDDSDRLRDLVRRANMDNNGTRGVPAVGLGISVQPDDRPSGFVCPKCGEETPQRWVPLLLNGEPIGGVQWLTLDDGTPMPVAVVADEVLERDASGKPTKIYQTRHCLNCFNIWQKRKMMEDIRANVPQIVRKESA